MRKKYIQGMGQYFLGEDGSLYQVQGFEAGGSAEPAKVQVKTWEKRTSVPLAGISSGPTVRCTRLSDRQ